MSGLKNEILKDYQQDFLKKYFHEDHQGYWLECVEYFLKYSQGYK